MKDYKTRLKKAFAAVFEAPDFNIEVIKKYFHLNYVQYVDGKTLNFEQFIKHIEMLKAFIADIKIKFVHLVAEGNVVCSVHYAEGIKKNGGRIKAKVIALFKFEDKKIIFCEELTSLIEGDESDRNLGSRH